MATKKSSNKNDETKARARYVDQPGQWKDITPASTKKKQAKEWKKFEAMMSKKKK